MQKTFQLLRRGDIEGVRQILDRKPEEVNAVSGDKPKRDQGQSLLQVAIKSGHLDIADLLIDRGANLHNACRDLRQCSAPCCGSSCPVG